MTTEQIIVENMKMIPTGHVGVQPVTLGLYGMGGMGKTLICKALCNRFHSESAGRVCHAEFQNDGDLLQVSQKILKDLTDVSKGLLHRAADLTQVLDLRIQCHDYFGSFWGIGSTRTCRIGQAYECKNGLEKLVLILQPQDALKE